MVNFTVPKNMGFQYGTLIRQSILSSSECVRIIAFSLGEQTLLTAGDIDLICFSTNLATLDIEMDNLISYPSSYSITVKEVLTVGDLRQKGISVLNKDDSEILLDTLGQEVTITLICNKVSGHMTSEDNKNTLISLGKSINGFKVISARSLDLKIEFKVKENLNSDEVNLSINSPLETSLIKESLVSINSILGSLNQKLC